ncbi:unnamed protein product, partial [Ixodes hexagonus]
MDTNNAERQMPALTPEQDRVRNRNVDGRGESLPSSGLMTNSQTHGDGNGGVRSNSSIEKEIELVREDERLLRLELELEHLRSGNRTRASGGGMEFNLRDEVLSFSRLMKGVLTPMPSSKILVPSWFDGVENVFETYEVPERLRGYLIQPYLTESPRALVNRLPVGETSGYGAVKERVLLALRLSGTEGRRPFLEATTSLEVEHEIPRQLTKPIHSGMGHFSRDCPRKTTLDTGRLHKGRVEAEKVEVKEDSSREPDKVTTNMGKADGNKLDHRDQEGPMPEVFEAPWIHRLFQADNGKQSSKKIRSSVSEAAVVDDEQESNVSCAWRTSRRAEDDHGDNVNVYDEGPYTLPGRQAFSLAEDHHKVNFDNVKAGPDILLEPDILHDWQTFWQGDDDHDENVDVSDKEESGISPMWRTSRQAEDDHSENVDVDKEESDILPGRRKSRRVDEDVRKGGDDDE